MKKPAKPRSRSRKQPIQPVAHRWSMYLPSEPPDSLVKPTTADADSEETVDDLFRLFGVDRKGPAADQDLWMAMAIRIFPSLNIPPKSPGRPKGTVRGQSLWACAALAERYDTFTDELRRKHPGMPDHATMTAFVRRNPEILKPFQKGIESPETLSIHTLHKKIAIGKKYYRLVDMHNVLSEPQILIEALSYMPFSEHLSFKRELLELDAGTEDGKSRILQIAKEVAHAVPSRISYGPVAFNPYWKRRSVK